MPCNLKHGLSICKDNFSAGRGSGRSVKFRCDDPEVRQPRFERLADLPEVAHPETDDQGSVRLFLPELLRREGLAALEVVGRLRVHLDEHLQVALLAKPEVGTLRDFPCNCVSYRIQKTNDRSTADRGFYPMV